MKRWITALLSLAAVLCMVLCFAACGAASDVINPDNKNLSDLDPEGAASGDFTLGDLLPGRRNSGGADPDDDFYIELILSHAFAPEDPLAVEMEQVADHIRERTDGAVEIQIYPSSQLAVYRDSIQQVVEGNDWIACEDPSYLADYCIDFEALTAPFLYTSPGAYSFVCQSDAVKELCEDIEDEYGVHVLVLDLNMGLRSLLGSNAFVTPEDLYGRRIRVPNSSLYINCLTAIGAEPVPMGFLEALPALRSGNLDGLEGTMSAFASNGAAEVVKQISMTSHMISTCGAYISSAVWNSIPEKYQTIVQEEFAAGAKHMTEAANKAAVDARKTLEEEQGCRFHAVDMEAFRAEMETEYARMVWEDGVTEDLIPWLRQLVEEYESAASEAG